jgi:hypothetical protein
MSFGRLRLTYGSTAAVVMLVISLTLIVLAALFLDRVVFKGRTAV